MSVIDAIKNAGIVGCGGAGFPTHVKLNGQFKYLIVNGAECEPLLRTDRYLMIHKSKELISAVEEVGKFTGSTHLVVALKREYTVEIAALQAAIKELNSKVTLHTMDAYYPTGDEQVIVNEVTGGVVPPAGLPKDVEAVVSNVATMVGIYDAMSGKSFTHKYLTVTGSVKTPSVILVPVGTKIADCIAAAGGTDLQDYYVVNGGPMMGKVIKPEQIATSYVTKTTSGLIVLPNTSPIVTRFNTELRATLKQAKTSCIQCSMCTDLCPRHMLGHPLQPHRIMRKLAYAGDITEVLDDIDVHQAMICSECGICEIVACPMGLKPRTVNQYVKGKLREAGFGYKRPDMDYVANEMKTYRNIPTKRVVARVGVSDYYHNKVDHFATFTPDSVTLLLRQHIGAPATPIVKVGETVTVGQMVASCDEGKLGANIHTGLSGKVVNITGDSIVIEK